MSSHGSVASDEGDVLGYYKQNDPEMAAFLLKAQADSKAREQARRQQEMQSALDRAFRGGVPDTGHDNYDDDVDYQRPRNSYGGFIEENYQQPAPVSAPKLNLGGGPLLGQGFARQQRDSDAEIPYANSVRESESEQGDMSDDAALNRMFANVGGLDEAAKASGEGGRGGAPAGAAKPGFWKRTGHFFKGIGHALKFPYNLIRHGLFGANYNRWQMNRHARKDEAAKAELARMNNPEGIAERKEAMGQEAFTARSNALHAKAFSANKKSGMAALNLVRNRMHYTGTHVAQNFTKAFSKKGDGLEGRNHPRLAKALVGDVRNIQVPAEWMVD